MTWSLSFLCSSSAIKISEANTHSLRAIRRGWVVRENQHRCLSRVCHFSIGQVEQVDLFLVATDSTTRLETNLTMSHTVCEGTGFQNLQLIVSKQRGRATVYLLLSLERAWGGQGAQPEEMQRGDTSLCLTVLKGQVWAQPFQCWGPIVYWGAG